MKPENAIEVENLSKRYYIGQHQGVADDASLVERLRNTARIPLHRLRAVLERKSPFASEEVIWALKDVSFEVKQGEILGVIGPNGAGKSTLLKILSRITLPSDGEARIRGRVGSLLEVSTGFNRELTGRENIYLKGAIQGATRRDVDAKFDEIVEFSGIERFLDTPVKRYSSGMGVRLAFSVAVHLQPEVVMIDEVLSVGDVSFRKKSLDKIAEIVHDGRTVLLVSHNLLSIQDLCTRVLFLKDGQVYLEGDTDDVLDRYLDETFTEHRAVIDLRTVDRPASVESDAVRFVKCAFVGADGEVAPNFKYAEPLTFSFEVESRIALRDLEINLAIHSNLGTRITAVNSGDYDLRFNVEAGETLHVTVALDELILKPGSYPLSLSIRQHRGAPLDRLHQVLSFEVLAVKHDPLVPINRGGIVVPRARWETTREAVLPAGQVIG